ncbi:MAG: hypothetical protein ACPGL0_13865 [Limisphaerales bacterium]|jgi:hypothetical protein
MIERNNPGHQYAWLASVWVFPSLGSLCILAFSSQDQPWGIDRLIAWGILLMQGFLVLKWWFTRHK